MQTLAQLREGSLADTTRLDLQENLRHFPDEIFDLAESLEILNLTGNQLASLPDELPRLKRLRILFCSDNAFSSLPEVLGACPSLEMVGFKCNCITHVPAASLPPQLRWLILTGNRISTLPDSFGSLHRLQKLMLSGNELAQLPESLAQCHALELLRIAANRLETVPGWLPQLPRLAWLAFAGNPCAATPPRLSGLAIPAIPWHDLTIGEKLGDGASGEIFSALWRQAGSHRVAVKLFKGEITSDGLPGNELLASLHAGLHAHLIPLLGHVIQDSDGRSGLVMECIDSAFTPLAGPPNFQTCTRDVYPPSLKLACETTLSLIRGVTEALNHLHERGILHGDLYAHNVLFQPDGRCYLGDLGAATFLPSPYHSEAAQQLKRLDLRALSILISELDLQTQWQSGESHHRLRITAMAQRLTEPDASLRDVLRSL